MINKEYARNLILDLSMEGYSLEMISNMLQLPISTILNLIKEN